MWACQKRAEAVTLNCSRKNSEVKGIANSQGSCNGRKCVSEPASSAHQLGTYGRAISHKQQSISQLYSVSNQKIHDHAGDYFKDKITHLNSNCALSEITKGKKFPMIPAIVRNTETEWVSKKYKECKQMNKNSLDMSTQTRIHIACTVFFLLETSKSIILRHFVEPSKCKVIQAHGK